MCYANQEKENNLYIQQETINKLCDRWTLIKCEIENKIQIKSLIGTGGIWYIFVLCEMESNLKFI